MSHCPNLPPQAKSQQDKRLWVLHLKRLILENHAAKIPAKVRQLRQGVKLVTVTQERRQVLVRQPEGHRAQPQNSIVEADQ
jgi:hypothetical protein